MKRWWVSMQNPRKRREWLALASGTLIAAALVAGRIPGWHGASNGLMIAAALTAGWDIAVRALISLKNRVVSIELLVTIATLGALALGETWEAAAVTFLFLFGAYLEARTLSQTRQVLQGLLDLAPTTALVSRDGRQVEVSSLDVQPGEWVWLKPGAKVPVDGVVAEGHSSIDESAITGEPMPEDKTEGAPVYAGSINQEGLLKVRATGIGADTTLARIIRRVEEAQDEKAPTQRFIERFSGWYTPMIIGLSAVVFLVTRDIELALTLLVIGCPGALVISTPVSVVAGIGRAAKSGILIKGGEYLENAGKITAVALDKTGTLTQGKPRLTEVIALAPALEPAIAGQELPNRPSAPHGTWTADEEDVIRWAAAAESGSEHPLARAILSETEQLGWVPAAQDFEMFTGRGIRAQVSGRTVLVGTEEFLSEQGVRVPRETDARLETLKSAGRTAVLVSVAGEAVGVLGISDPIREDAAEMVLRLKHTGVQQVVMLTGDDQLTAQTIAAQAGIDTVHAELLPEQKLEWIRKLKEDGHVVAMVGDGINDAPALAAADIGIAMGAAGTDIAIETADIALMADDLMKIPEAVSLSRAAQRNIRQNVWIALLTVAMLLSGVLLGQVHMAGGMLIHEASVMVVIANAMRLLKKKMR